MSFWHGVVISANTLLDVSEGGLLRRNLSLLLTGVHTSVTGPPAVCWCGKLHLQVQEKLEHVFPLIFCVLFKSLFSHSLLF